MPDTVRTLIAFGAAGVASILAAVLAGCIGALLGLFASGHFSDVYLGTPKDGSLLELLFLVSNATAAAAAVVSLSSIVIFAWPVYVLATRNISKISLWHCMVGGLVVSAFTIAIVVGVQNRYAPIPSIGVYLYEGVAILFSGTIASMVFWAVRFQKLEN